MTELDIGKQVLNNKPADEGSEKFARFAAVAEQIGATTKHWAKIGFLGQYFTSLSDLDLQRSARYFAGYLFPLKDQRTTKIGGAALLAALAVATGIETIVLQSHLTAKGDLGEVAAEVFPDRSPSLTLEEVTIGMEQLAVTQGTKRKIEQVIRLLSRATSLEAKYLIKLLTGDLRIGLKEGIIEDTIARLFHQPVERIQWVNMLTGDIGETAALARRDQLDAAQMRPFHPIKFMLASPVTDLEEVMGQMPQDFFVEDKYDGIRAQVHIAPDFGEGTCLQGVPCGGMRIALFSRTLDEITATFPDLVLPLAGIPQASIGHPPGLILDGEIVPVRGTRILPFQELQKRLGRKTFSEMLLKNSPVAFIAYDVLYFQGEMLVDHPFSARRSVLDSLKLNGIHLKSAISQQFHTPLNLDRAFDAARDRGNEGLMLKDPIAPYKPGHRGQEWLKVKRSMVTLDVVVTAVEAGRGRRHTVLSDYTLAVRTSETDPALLSIGKAHSGLTDAEIAELSDWFHTHTLQEVAHGKLRTVEPRIVLEVTFDRVQISKHYRSGYALRFPRILRIRHDKSPEEIDTVATVRLLAKA